jgi:hypothetical protein
MGWRFRKIFRSGPWRWTWTKKGVGWSWGIPGFRYGVSPTGQRYISVGIPGTGFYFIKYLDKEKPIALPSPPSTPEAPQPQQTQSTPESAERWWEQKNLGD